MLLLLAKNPAHPSDVKKKRNFFGTKLFKFVKDEECYLVPKSEIIRGRFIPKRENSKGHWIFQIDAETILPFNKRNIPQRILAKISRVKRLWILSHITPTGQIAYKSVNGDTLLLKED